MVFTWPGGVLNLTNNLLGSTTVLNSINFAEPAIFMECMLQHPVQLQRMYKAIPFAVLIIQHSRVGLSLPFIPFGRSVNVGTTSPNVIGSNTTAGAITYAGTGGIYGLYIPSSNPGNKAWEQTLSGTGTCQELQDHHICTFCESILQTPKRIKCLIFPVQTPG